MEKLDIFSRLKQYEKKNIYFWTEDEKLKYRAGSGVLTQEDFAFLKANKTDIITALEKKAEESKYTIDEEHRYEPFPLTDVQQAYLLGRNNAFDYGGVACHIYMQFEYDELDTARVQEIWNKLIAHHDMLRVQIYEEGYQQVLKEVPEFHVDEYFKDDSEKIIEDMSHRVYDTSKWPLFGVAVQKGNEKDILHFSIEFLIADWTSIWMLLTKFEAMYFDGDDKIQENPVQFRDYVIAENKCKEGAVYEKDKAYWIARVADFAEAPKLPTLPENKELKPEFERRSIHLENFEWEKIKQKAVGYGVTPAAVIMALYARVLALYSQNKRFVLNLTVLNRQPFFEEVDRIIGDFTSVNLLEVNMAEGDFVHQARAIASQLFEDLDHRTFSGIEVIREITRVKGKDEAFMPYVFTSALGLLQSIEKGNIRGFRNEGGISQTPQVFIDCQVMDGDFGFQANWDVRKNVFRSEVIDGMFEIFCEGLKYLSENEWDSFVVKRPAWQQEIIDKTNDTAKELKTYLIHEPVIRAAKAKPDKIAVIQGNKSVTYSELLRDAGRIYSNLKEKGCKKGDMIAIAMEKSVYQVSAVLAVLSLGAGYVPIQYDSPKKRLESIIKQTKASAVVTLTTSKVSGVDIPVIYADKCNGESVELPVEGNKDGIAYVIFTSGSTGEPKGVVISHRGASNTIEDINERLGITENDTAFGLSELHFDLSVYDIFGILAKGGTLILPEQDKKSDPSYLAKMVVQHNITVWNSVPAYMQMMMEYVETIGQYQFPSLRRVMLSGDFIPLNLPESCLSKMPYVKIYSLGGATEGSIWSIIHKYDGLRPEDKTILYGKPLANQEFRILDELKNEVPMYVEGELYIVGDGVALGYLGDEEKTRQHFLHDPKTGKPMYRTGDFGRYQSDGNIEFIGRKDEQVKIRGHRIELGEIEKALSSIDSSERAVAVIDDTSKDKKIVGFMTTRKKNEVERKAAKEKWNRLFVSCEKEAYEFLEDVTEDDIRKIMEMRDNAIAYDMAGALQMVKETDINPEILWLVDYWKNVLKDRIFSGEYSFEKSKKNWEKLYEVVNEEVISRSFLKYLDNSCRNLTGLLTGSVNPIDILYPEGDDSITAEMYVKNTMSRYLNRCVCTLVKQVAEDGRKLRILEIGAGTAATSLQVLEAIKDFEVEYYFTDISPFFITEAKKKLEKYTNVSYKLLDIDQPIEEQGFTENYFDIIIAVGVLENAKDIRFSLKQVRKLAASEGMFFFTEPIFEELWILASQAFLMTCPEDEIRKNKAFVDERTWISLISEMEPGTDIKVIPKNNKKFEPFGLKLFAVQMKADNLRPDVNELKKQLEDYIPEYMIPYKYIIVEQFPLTLNGKLDRKKLKEQISAREELLTASKDVKMTGKAADIQAVFKEIGLGQLSVNDNFYDHGADSLIMAKAAGKIREKIVPDIAFDSLLRQMLNYPTICELVEYIDNIHGKETKVEFNESEENDTNGVFTFYGGGEERLRVICHAALGTMNCFRYLIPNLVKQKKGQVLGISVKDSDKYIAVQYSELIEHLADDYAEQIVKMGYEKVQMIGYCYAGWLSIEVGNRLIERGLDVEDLVLIDSHIVPFRVENDLMIELLYISNIYVSVEQVGIDSQKLQDAIEYVVSKVGGIFENADEIIGENPNFADISGALEKLKAMTFEERFKMYVDISKKNTGKEMGLHMAKGLFNVYKHTFKSINYTEHAFIGDVRYIRAREEATMFYDKERTLSYWESLSLGDFTVTEIEGNHYTCIEEPEHAEVLAEMVGEVLE